MKKMLKMGLLGLVIGAGAAFAAATVGTEEAVAAECCSTCLESYDACMEGCVDSSCIDACGQRWGRCASWCAPSC